MTIRHGCHGVSRVMSRVCVNSKPRHDAIVTGVTGVTGISESRARVRVTHALPLIAHPPRESYLPVTPVTPVTKEEKQELIENRTRDITRDTPCHTRDTARLTTLETHREAA